MYYFDWRSGAYTSSRESSLISKLYIKVPWGYLVINCDNPLYDSNNNYRNVYNYFIKYGNPNGENLSFTYYFK